MKKWIVTTVAAALCAAMMTGTTASARCVNEYAGGQRAQVCRTGTAVCRGWYRGYQAGSGSWCRGFVDNNNDSLCDNWGSGNGCNYADADNDGVCDNWGSGNGNWCASVGGQQARQPAGGRHCGQGGGHRGRC